MNTSTTIASTMFGTPLTSALLRVWVGILLFAGTWHCRPDVEKFEPYEDSASEIEDLLLAGVPDATTYSAFAFNALSSDEVLITSSGLRIFLTDTEHLFADSVSGFPVPCSTCPDLRISVTEVLRKGDIAARKVGTVGNDGKLFRSSGMVKISARCGSQILQLLPDRTLKVQIPANAPQEGLKLFEWSPQNNWQATNQPVFVADWPAPVVGQTQLGYELLLQKLGWASAGLILSDSASTTFCVKLPPIFASDYTKSFLVFEDLGAVVPMLYDEDERFFCASNVPTGYPVRLVTVSKLGNQYWSAEASTETGTNSVLPLDPQKTTEQSVIALFKNL
jgi:hypothetical protein